ncbi:MAG TPA: hypothetical protein VG500_10185, partial [Gemmatimonadales bacterium]|nr:hypothetical protein [Gemmatimonadales bacterium]
TYGEKVQAQTVASVSAAAKSVIHPDRLVWVVVGDRSRIESGIRALNLGEVRFIDADGQPIGAS